jgi:transcriptional regulator with XRE-family HTH domain
MSDNKREQSPWSIATSAQIRAERAAAGLTQAQMVELSGISRSSYIRLEKGERVADITQLARICGALGLPLSVFLARVEERKPEGEEVIVNAG